MKGSRFALAGLAALLAVGIVAQTTRSQNKSTTNTANVYMVVTDQAVHENDDLPILRSENVQVMQGKNKLDVTEVVPARGNNSALQLMILVDESCDSSFGSNLNELREFINAQPATTAVGVAYMSHGTIQITQNLTADHALTANALRLPRGILSPTDSPYMSLTSLVKGWPEQKVRREVLIITDGIDRLRRSQAPPFFASAPVPFSLSGRSREFSRPSSQTTMPEISPDADSTSMTSQRHSVIVHSIYVAGIGRVARNAWEVQLGQAGIAKIADQTGGEYYALGQQNAVSFQPYLNRLRNIFDNQYYVEFQAVPRQKDGLQRVNISTAVANSELAAADNVWVPAGKQE